MKFIKSVFAEMKAVTWPTAQQTRRDTFTVIMTSIILRSILRVWTGLSMQSSKPSYIKT